MLGFSVIQLLDILIAIILVLFLVRGVVRGIVRELFSLASVVIGWVIASRYHMELSAYIPSVSGETQIGNAALFVLTFLGAALVIRILGVLFHKIVTGSPLGIVNRLIGGVCGLLIGTILIGLILMVTTVYLPYGRTIKEESVLFPHLKGVIELLSRALPEEGRQLFDEHWKNRGAIPDNLDDYI